MTMSWSCYILTASTFIKPCFLKFSWAFLMPVIQQSLTKLLSRPLATFTEVMDLAWWHHCRRAKVGSITKQICLHRHKRYLDVLMEMRIECFNLLIYLNLRQCDYIKFGQWEVLLCFENVINAQIVLSWICKISASQKLILFSVP